MRIQRRSYGQLPSWLLQTPRGNSQCFGNHIARRTVECNRRLGHICITVPCRVQAIQIFDLLIFLAQDVANLNSVSIDTLNNGGRLTASQSGTHEMSAPFELVKLRTPS